MRVLSAGRECEIMGRGAGIVVWSWSARLGCALPECTDLGCGAGVRGWGCGAGVCGFGV